MNNICFNYLICDYSDKAAKQLRAPYIFVRAALADDLGPVYVDLYLCARQPLLLSHRKNATA